MKPYLHIVLLFALTSACWANRRSPVVEAVETTLPSVVNIGTEKYVQVSYNDPRRRVRGTMFDQFFREFFGPPHPPNIQKRQSLGSGVIVDRAGYILTNYHVVLRADRIWVTLADGQQYDARLIAGDEASDLALIKVDAPGMLPEVQMAKNDDLLLGETVIVLGNPYGLGHTVTVGVLSAKNILQTDAAVNPGSSGGPMMNVDGHLIGISVAIHREAENIGFAIPVKRVRALMETWFKPSLLENIWLGLDFIEHPDGIYIGQVEENSPASEAGLIPGAKVTSVNGTVVKNELHAFKSLVGTHAGDPVDIELNQGGDITWHRLTAQKMPELDGEAIAAEMLGLQFIDKSTVTNVTYNGLLFSEIQEGSPAQQVGIKPGLYLSRINQMEVNTVTDISSALAEQQRGDWVELDVVSLEERQSLVLARTSRLKLQLQ